MAVDWHGDRVLAKLKVASEKMVTEAALLIKQQVQVNITNNGQVDTGFMRESVYAVAPGAEVRPEVASGHEWSPIEGRDVYREAAPMQQPPEGGAVVGVAASYTIYQEERNPFLYPAVVEVAGKMGGEIVAAGREEMND